MHTHKSQWRSRVAAFTGNLVMDIWKCPEEVTNERCKVKCPVKSSGDLKQAAFLQPRRRFPQAMIHWLVTARDEGRCEGEAG